MLYRERVRFTPLILIQVDDVRRLFDTRGGDYAAACALDFAKPTLLYDTFALRDSEGHDPLMLTWPYFRSRGSREALKSAQPVPVASCWNGMGKALNIRSLLALC